VSLQNSISRRRFVGQAAAMSVSAAAYAGRTTHASGADGDAEKPNQSLFRIGAASKVINPEVGDYVQGAGAVRRATEIRDDLEANGLFLSNGENRILLVSCDLVGLTLSQATQIREATAQATGISPRDVLITCTHTHGGPSLLKTNYLIPVNGAYLNRLQDWLIELANEAVQSARPGKIAWGKGEAPIGHNRRCCWADGSHTMNGDVSREDFTGREGPDDPQHSALFAADVDGNLIAVLHHNTAHPTLFYGRGIFSADFPGEARRILRKELGDVPVLYLNGAQGDIGIRGTLEDVSRLVVEETLRLYEDVRYYDSPVLAHDYEDLAVPVRLPEPERLAEARELLSRIDAGENIRGQSMIMAFGASHLQEEFGENPVDTVPIHVLRIGDAALVTQPCELFCQFGLDIKRRSPASITAAVGLADGYCGYCPTIYGILGGGYSAAPIHWTRLEPYAGYRIVETAALLLNRLWG
jgi:neutral ceramidase